MWMLKLLGLVDLLQQIISHQQMQSLDLLIPQTIHLKKEFCIEYPSYSITRMGGCYSSVTLVDPPEADDRCKRAIVLFDIDQEEDFDFVQ